jgi:hypothetical protein
MVSYAEESTLTPPSSSINPPPLRSSRAPSVAGTTRSSTVRASRHHRHTKSHAGVPSSSTSSTSSHPVLNEFPTFERSGDVEIVLKNGRREMRYVLHRLYLAQCSGWFEDVLGLRDRNEDDVKAGGTARAFARRVRFELDWGRDNTDEMPLLVLKVCNRTLPAIHTLALTLRSRPPLHRQIVHPALLPSAQSLHHLPMASSVT